MKIVAIVITKAWQRLPNYKNSKCMKYLSMAIATFFITPAIFANEKAPAAITNDVFSLLTHPIILGGIIALLVTILLVIFSVIYWKYNTD
jgi:hypothetical protein